MTLNSLMHPRNPFKDKKPDFSVLAAKYEAFRKQTTTDSKGKVHIDFKNPTCLKALTWVLLKDEYDIDVEIPTDRLIPTIPLRINYILWLEDILSGIPALKGIDLGTGAVCVYPIIGAKKNGWSFLAAEADATNVEYASRNVQLNGLSSKITVVKVSEGSSLLDILHNSDEQYDFCMCNPPFYGSNLEAWGVLTTRSEKRPEPSSVNTASPVECITPGGEVEFVKEMIVSSSLILEKRVRVYTSMLGKKSSLSKLKEILRENKISNFASTEFCQGNTMRWAIAWSFDERIQFPKPASKKAKSEATRPPLVLSLPKKSDEKAQDTAILVEKLLLDLKVSFVEKTDALEASHNTCWVVTAYENTWSHQRQKRRKQAQEQLENLKHAGLGASTDPEREVKEHENEELPSKRFKQDVENSNETLSTYTAGCQYNNETNTCTDSSLKTETEYKETTADKYTGENQQHAAETKRFSADDRDSYVASEHLASSVGFNSSRLTTNKAPKLEVKLVGCKTSVGETGTDPSDLPLLKCTVAVVQEDSGTAIHFDWLSGPNREYMHQLMQYFKNKLI